MSSPQARWNLRNREAIKASAKRLEERNLRIVAEELECRGGKCIFEGCTETEIEWHHRDPATKNFNIGSSVRLHSASRLQAELALCDPCCRRHHMVVDGRLERAIAHKGYRYKPRTFPKPGSKLTEEQVKSIRVRVANGESQAGIARDLSVTQSLISNVARRRAWAWVSD